jgi:MFS family permease
LRIDTTTTDPERAFRVLLFSVACSESGLGAAITALPVMMVAAGWSPFGVGVFFAARQLPSLLSPVVGVVIDRAEQKTLLVAANLLGFLATVVLVTTVEQETSLGRAIFFAASLVAGVSDILFQSTLTAYMPTLVREAEYPSASAKVVGVMGAGTTLVGPSIAALLMGWGPHWAVWFNASTLALTAVLLATLPRANSSRRADDRDWWDGIRQGAHWLRSEPRVLVLLPVAFALNGAIAAIQALLAFIASELLHMAPAGFAALLGAHGVGGLWMGMGMKKFVRRHGLHATLKIAALTASGCLLVVASQPTTMTTVLAFAAFGASTVAWRGASSGLRLRLVPAAMTGRVSGLWLFMSSLAYPLASVTAGRLSDFIGLRLTLAFGGTLLLVASVYFVVRSRTMVIDGAAASRS